MTELLYKTIREEEANLPLFKHIATSLNTLDNQSEALANFPITFMLSTAKLLGIEPRNNYDNHNTLFNLNEGCFVTQPSIVENADNILDSNTSSALHQYLSNPNTSIPYHLRNAVLKSLLQYYKIHFENLSDFQSHIILHEVLQ
jgi:DNA repair protein RecO (recombination protein O)